MMLESTMVSLIYNRQITTNWSLDVFSFFLFLVQEDFDFTDRKLCG